METGQPISPNSPKLFSRPVVWLLLIWALVQAFLLFRYGIFTKLESEKYIDEANNILTKGTVSSANFWLYSTQIFLIALATKLKAGYVFVCAVQLFFSGLAIYYFFRFAERISSVRAAMVVSLLLIFNLPFQTYNVFLQTESLFFSFTILFSCYLFQLKRLTVSSSLLLFLFIALICVTRPSGLLFVPCAFIYLFFRFFTFFSTPVKIGITAAAAIGFLFVLNAALGSGGELDFMLPFRDERIICGVPTTDGFVDIRTSSDPNSVEGLLYYISHNFEQFTRLAWIKTKAFFGLVRSYYGTGHNIYLALFFYPVYLLSLISIPLWWRKNRNILLYCSAIILVTWLSVILSCDDWHNRFFLTVIPYFYVLVIPVIQRITDKLFIDGRYRSV